MEYTGIYPASKKINCTVNGIKYVACNSFSGCDGCVAERGSNFCESLGDCSCVLDEERDAIWRPASEFDQEHIPVGTLSVIDGEMGPNPTVHLLQNLPLGEYELVAVRKEAKE